MKPFDSFLAELSFTLICVFLCLLTPRQIGASLLDTTNTNGNGDSNVQLKSSLEDDVDFGSSHEAMEYYMRREKSKACNCGPIPFQKKYCTSDFAITAKKFSGEPQQFFPDSNWTGFNYSWLAVPLVVQQRLLGSVGPEVNIVVNFVLGSICGVPRKKIPDGDRTYIVAGFRQKIFDSDGKQTKEVLLVTKCGISQPLESLSLTQLAGFFFNWYCSKASCHTEFDHEGPPRNLSSRKKACFYPYEGRKCYDRFTICARFSERVPACEAQSVNSLPPTQSTLKNFPPEVHGKLKEFFDSKVNDGQRFGACLEQFGVAIPVDDSPLPPVTSSCPPQILLSPLFVALPIMCIYAYLCEHF
ncbi:hypothetical protein Aperf_G00000012603 [Anoplocephala perfoliata]